MGTQQRSQKTVCVCVCVCLELSLSVFIGALLLLSVLSVLSVTVNEDKLYEHHVRRSAAGRRRVHLCAPLGDAAFHCRG